MSVHDRIEALKAKHAALESAIETEARRPTPDNAHLHDLKRKKLRIKDEITQIATTAH